MDEEEVRKGERGTVDSRRGSPDRLVHGGRHQQIRASRVPAEVVHRVLQPMQRWLGNAID